MSRHRDIRCMNYSDEYDGYDDVYGHSVEDDYCVSPGAEQFMYDRNKQQNIASFITEPDIKEDNEEEYEDEAVSPKNNQLSDIDTAKLMSCIEVIRNVIGDALPDTVLKEKIIAFNFDTQIILDHILNTTLATKTPTETTVEAKKQIAAQTGERLLSSSENSISEKNQSSSRLELVSNHKPKFLNFSVKSPISFKQITPIQQSSKMNSPTNPKTVSQNKISFNSLAEMTAHHLEKSKDSSNKSNFAPKIFNKPFVIPKLSSKITSSQTNSTNEPKVTDFIAHSGQNSNECLSSVITDSETEKTVNHNIKDQSNESHNCSEQYKSCSDSPDTFNLEIDLTAALRDSKKMYKKANNHENVQENITTPVEMFNLDKIYEQIETLPSSIIEKNSNILECNLNMMSLRYKKLNHLNKVVSLFGKILCKKWKPHSRPYIKPYRSELNKNIKRFDFTSLSPDGIVLANLRRL